MAEIDWWNCKKLSKEEKQLYKILTEKAKETIQKAFYEEIKRLWDSIDD